MPPMDRWFGVNGWVVIFVFGFWFGWLFGKSAEIFPLGVGSNRPFLRLFTARFLIAVNYLRFFSRSLNWLDG